MLGGKLMSTDAIVVAYVTAALVLALWNKQKGHGFWLGLIYSLLLTPVIGLLTIALAQKVTIVVTRNGRRRSCPHCFSLTSENVSFCEMCGKHIGRQTAKQFIQMAELFVGLVLTVLLVKLFF
jgi:hypothetical protein